MLISFTSADIISYDDFRSGILSTSKWNNASAISGGSISLGVVSSAPNFYAEARSTSGGGTFASANITSNNLPSSNFITNISLEGLVQIDEGNTGVWFANLTIFGNSLSEGYAETSLSFIDRNNWTLNNIGNNNFRVFRNGIFNKTITALNNNITMISSSYDGSSGEVTRVRLYYLNYSLLENTVNTYNPTTYETSRESYFINFSSINGIVSISSSLVYKNVSYPAIAKCTYSGICGAGVSLDIPTLPSGTGTQNNDFYWNITLFDGTNSLNTITQTYSQQVNQLNLTYCGGGTIAFNFSAFDEQNKTRINPYSFDGTFNYYTGTGTTYKTLSVTNSSVNEVLLCINQNTTYYADAIIAYSSPSTGSYYPLRNYFFKNYKFNNSKQDIPLYLLKSSASTSFILQVQDRSLLPVAGVLVNAQRCYPGTNNNETVFISRTDANGLTTGNFEAETALYKFSITNNSRILLAIDQCSNVVPQTTPYTLLFQLGVDYSSPFINIDNSSGITKNLFYNSTSHILSFTYTDPSSNFYSAELIATEVNYTGTASPNQIVCFEQGALSSGILSCNITTAGTYTAVGNIYHGTTIGSLVTIATNLIFTVETFSSSVGYYGVFLGFFILLILGFAFKFNEIAGIWLEFVGVVFCNAVGLINFGWVFITALFCVCLLLTGVLER